MSTSSDIPTIISVDTAYELSTRGLQKKSKDLIEWINGVIKKAADQGFFRVVVNIPPVIADMLERAEYLIYREDSKHFATTVNPKEQTYENGVVQKCNSSSGMNYIICWKEPA